MMVNTKHDTTSYENCICQREIYDGNALYDAYLTKVKYVRPLQEIKGGTLLW